MTVERDLTPEASAIAARVAELLGGRGRGDEPFYTPETLATRLSVTRRTVYTLLRRGTIRSYKVESAIRIDPADVDTYLQARVHTSERQAA